MPCCVPRNFECLVCEPVRENGLMGFREIPVGDLIFVALTIAVFVLVAGFLLGLGRI